jgi:rhodanese-related sulfurtransferase
VSGLLRKQGYAEAFALRGGIAAWQQASLPLEKG